MDLSPFLNKNLFEAGQNFFDQLGIKLNSSTTISIDVKEVLKDLYKARPPYNYIIESYFLGLIDDNLFGDSLFSSSDDKISYKEASKIIDSKYKGIIVYAVNLGDNYLNRTQISELTRAFNRASKSAPVILLARYKNDEGDLLSFSTIERTNYEQIWREGEKTGKVSLLRDIKLTHTHTGHKKILLDLKIDSSVKSFDALYKQWQEVFNVQLLNKKFFQELANWYFWAITKVNFPDDVHKDKEVRNATNVIRLLTRLIFVWFIKEKGLVPEDLFEENKLKDILKFNDANKSSYYKAILQNLFFATLNTEMGKRRFRGQNDNGRDAHYFIHNVFRYKSEFIKPQETLEKLFDPVPFLNGGLFECLDKEVEIKNKLVPVRIDGFSDRDDNPLKVPDQLFFSPEKEVDLNKVYDTNNKKYKVRGLINLLSSYKFTIAENTPLEEDIALDPELLGKVFENLLANYNPETQTTARKQTGSFYTPREIVNYMVDESLIAHLKTKMLSESFGFIQIGDEQIDAFGNIPRKGQLKIEEDVNKNRWKGKEDELEKALRNLISYSETELAFNFDEKKALIKAIDTMKVLDPACGSGAFPMGILHKLVLMLHKLDSNNTSWKKRQIERAESIEDPSAREEAVSKIENAFEKNELDYGRKLYLIENCIYGIDIQPIAAQISKLRFFISLIVDQKVNWNSPNNNYDIEPLPNLETKFVAANTLLGIERPEELRFNKAVEIKENELRKNRERYFTARSSKTKEKFREKDKAMREEIVKLIKTDFEEFVTTKQNQIKEKQKLIALYSKELDKTNEKLNDKKLTEGLKKNLEKQAEKQLKAIKAEEKKIDEFEALLLDSAVIDETASILASWDPYDQNAYAPFFDMEWMFGFKDGFDIVIGNPPYGAKLDDVAKYKTLFPETSVGNIDSYKYFIDKGIDLIKKNGNLIFITSDSYLEKDYFDDLRTLVLKKSNDIFNIKLGDNIFDKVNLPTAIIFLKIFGTKKMHFADVAKYTMDEKVPNIERVKTELKYSKNYSGKKSLFNNLNCKKLIDLYDQVMGVKVYQVGKGKPKQTIREFENDLFVSEKKIGKKWLPFVEDGIKRYEFNPSKKYIKYGQWLAEPRKPKYFINPKVLIREVVNPRVFSCYVKDTYVVKNTAAVIIQLTPEFDLFFLLGLVNSIFFDYYISSQSPKRDNKSFPSISSTLVKNFTIPVTNEKIRIDISDKVCRILELKAKNQETDTSKLERNIDELVYKLYNLNEEEIAIVEGKSKE